MTVFQIIYDENGKQNSLLNNTPLPNELLFDLCKHFENIKLFENDKIDFSEIFTEIVKETKSTLFENGIPVLTEAEKWLSTHKISHFNAISLEYDGVIRHIVSFGDKDFTDDIHIQFIVSDKTPTYTQNINSTYASLCSDQQQIKKISSTLAKIYYFINLALTDRLNDQYFIDLTKVEVNVIACIITFVCNAKTIEIPLEKLNNHIFN